MDWYPLLYFPAHRRDLDLRDLLRGDLCRLLYRKAAADPQRHSGRYSDAIACPAADGRRLSAAARAWRPQPGRPSPSPFAGKSCCSSDKLDKFSGFCYNCVIQKKWGTCACRPEQRNVSFCSSRSLFYASPCGCSGRIPSPK